MADWGVERLGRIADTPITFLLPFGHFSSQRGSRDNGIQPRPQPDHGQSLRKQSLPGQRYSATPFSGQSRFYALSAMQGTRHVLAMACYVYVLAAKNKGGRCVTYVGWTLDLDRRLAEHNGAGKRGAKSTRGRVWVLLYAEKHRTRRKAMAREYALKQDRAFRARLRSP